MQSIRRSRSVLVELMIAVLFLAIAACILAQLFAAAWETGEESRHTQAALLIARDTLERFTGGVELPEIWTQSMNGQEYIITTHVTEESAAAGKIRTCAVAVGCENVIYAEMETSSYTMEALQNENM